MNAFNPIQKQHKKTAMKHSICIALLFLSGQRLVPASEDILPISENSENAKNAELQKELNDLLIWSIGNTLQLRRKNKLGSCY